MLAVALALTAAPSTAEPGARPVTEPAAVQRAVRRCVAAARDTGAIIACEVQARRQWLGQLQSLREALRKRLEDRDLRQLERSVAAWEAYRAAELALLARTLGERRDGLAAALLEGAKTDLIRQRVEQLRAHLASLSRSEPGAAP